MATADQHQQSATITIPADYLEDVRSAFVAEIHNDGGWLRDMQKEFASDESVDMAGEDRAGAFTALRKDVQMLEQLLDATEATSITADRGTLFSALEALGNLLVKRLEAECVYSPLDMAVVQELAGRLSWTAKQALAVYPSSTEAVA